MRTTNRRSVVMKALARTPKATLRDVARKLFESRPDLFKSRKDARNAVYYFQANPATPKRERTTTVCAISVPNHLLASARGYLAEKARDGNAMSFSVLVATALRDTLKQLGRL